MSCQGDFDIIGGASPIPEAEIIKVLYPVFLLPYLSFSKISFAGGKTILEGAF